MSRPKILCLHGFGESADLFKIRSRNFRSIVGEHAELVYPDAPIDVGSLRDALEDSSESSGNQDFVNLSWWWTRRGGKTIELRGFTKTMEYIGKILNEQGPFDGILGFSQGGCLAVVIAALLEGRDGPAFGIEVNHPPIKFLVVAGAFETEAPQYQYIYDKPLANTPSMHMMGTYDTVVGIAKPRQLLKMFENPVVFEFDGGHFIPQTPKCVRTMTEFLVPHIPGLQPKPSTDIVPEHPPTPPLESV
ncbi:hypothetical protein LPJ60_002746 [Coemansia sp. RSA 2675]|uniref:Uncharacterized protein n=1 Tax=Coemansia linderi TaxID=2663919 RepID=A0ACC1KNY8_9FUNG|nr:hypothetical protein LPJ60_002746 [Coemansia sp. RSA 2675]KAJ2022967.1 hypothetical protein GGI06_001600 [Coemansia sp. S85]KAJ2409521.1 hypothetical protein GGI10_004683 [Coemansia sp. RSA 2530]KAJ2694636.1 hypothetical protein H4218_005525 [Coemansia sp. IMI 209128]KAJ2792256.1 hypothetical protein GGI18_000546 [Coemansia linderi]